MVFNELNLILFLGNRKGERWKRIISGIYLAFVSISSKRTRAFQRFLKLVLYITPKTNPRQSKRSCGNPFPLPEYLQRNHRFQGPYAQNGTLQPQRAKRQQKLCNTSIDLLTFIPICIQKKKKKTFIPIIKLEMERKKANGKWWALIRISHFPNNSPRFTVKWVYYKNPKAHRIENPEEEEEEEEEKRWILWHWANPETKSNPSIFLLLPPRERVGGVKDFFIWG